ncbi:O-antigen ligase family protein [Coriobacteriia bacterium Es71-Z0120]|uniref:O-antigen ligase family protein n=1 Tax=Parvivirga hydrogeniphila TaxID=2939460 RepID=UPI002260EA20|nr:O-antigen ligase family protein [Parvivirga hydrogeniphila]MCL4078688.1 O-antigen ligase family protein [Parvivirga hydrogeniphila]
MGSRTYGGISVLQHLLLLATLAVAVYWAGIVLLAAVAGIIVISWAAHRFPILAAFALLVVVLISQLSLMMNLLPEGWDVLPGGVRISDLILVGMWGASVATLFRRIDRSPEAKRLLAASALLSALLLVAILRNWTTYGLSAPGEFRFRYLILGLPIFLAIHLTDEKMRESLASLLSWSPVIGALAVLPIAVAKQGIQLSASSRWYPASISLGLLLAATWLFVSSRVASRSVSQALRYLTLLFVAFIVLKDAHRSVWLVAAVILLILMRLRVVEVGRLAPWLLVIVVSGAAILSTVGLTVPQLIAYITSRGSAFIRPTSDPTSYWRLVTWKSYLNVFMEHPWLGEGFGGYWDVYVPEFDARITVMPHSLYVQTLVKLGVTGMMALLAWFGAAASALVAQIKRAASESTSARALALMGLLGVAASLTFGTAYSLDFWPLAWIGIGLAAVFSPESEISPNER